MSFSHTSTVPIRMLPGIGIRTAKVLERLDIRTVGEFKNTPEKVLVELFGPSIRTLHNYVVTGRFEVTKPAAKAAKQWNTKPVQKTKPRKGFAQKAKLLAMTFAML